jgi:hypothetical protein
MGLNLYQYMNTTLKLIIPAIVLAVTATAADKKACDACKACGSADGKKAVLISGKESKPVVVASNQFTRGVRSVRLAK